MKQGMNAAIAALIALGHPIPDAVDIAQKYTWQALDSAFHIGMGQHHPNRFFWKNCD